LFRTQNVLFPDCHFYRCNLTDSSQIEKKDVNGEKKMSFLKQENERELQGVNREWN
jgi:hypothetical protein